MRTNYSLGLEDFGDLLKNFMYVNKRIPLQLNYGTIKIKWVPGWSEKVMTITVILSRSGGNVFLHV